MSRRKRKRQLRSALFIIAIALLIVGFMIRRLMFTGVMRGSAGPHQHSGTDEASPDYAHNTNPEGEHISDSDRQKLNDVIRQKTGDAK